MLFNDEFNLTKDFRESFVRDIMKGVAFLHESCQIAHGSMNTHTCLVTQYWSLKLSDYGLNDVLDEFASRDMIVIEVDDAESEAAGLRHGLQTCCTSRLN